MADRIATREAYGKALVEFGAEYDNLVVLDADLAAATKTGMFKKAYPDRFFDCGIAENNMIGVAVGLALSGKIPFASSFAMFAAGRSFEQVRNSVGYPHANVKIGATHGGITVGEDGATHQCLEDFALMRTIPGMTVICPADAVAARLAVKAAIDTDGPMYLRFGRMAVPTVCGADYRFEIGRGVKLCDGTDVSIKMCIRYRGMESETLCTMTEVIADEMKKCGCTFEPKLVALSGPTHAEEVAIGMPTSVVCACSDEECAQSAASLFMNSCMRVYTNTDVKGVELCGALKNIIALASGMSTGMGYGDNTRAMLITRGIAEMTRMGLAMGCKRRTFMGLAGIGDLIVTCTSQHSRNNRCGEYIGRGMTYKEAVSYTHLVAHGALPKDRYCYTRRRGDCYPRIRNTYRRHIRAAPRREHSCRRHGA